jgi:hypothetical protein
MRGVLRGLGVLLAVAAVHFFRDPANFLLPPLSYEDGRDFFAFFYNHRDPGAILRFYAGYVSLVPNLIGHAVMWLPVRWVPRALAWAPGLLVTLACALPYWTFRPWMPSAVWRFGTCLTLALLPVANRLFLSSTAYSIWPLLLILVWAALARPPERMRSAVLRGVPMTALICSHPLSIALVPIYGLQVWKGWLSRSSGNSPESERGRSTTLVRVSYPLALLAVTILYLLFGVERGGAETPGLWATVTRTFLFLLERVVFATLFSDAAVHTLRKADAVGWIYGGAILVLVGIGILVVRHRRRLGEDRLVLLGSLGWLILAFTGLYVVGRSPELRILEAGAAFRYFWDQRLLFAAGLAVLAGGLRQAWSGRVPPALLLWSLLLGLSILNFLNQDAYRCPRRHGRRMAGFVAEVARQEATGGRVEATLPRGGPWSVELRRPPQGATPVGSEDSMP